ncbi:MAG: hypothetical protein ABL957_05290 [Parvularculaceae bacterium]
MVKKLCAAAAVLMFVTSAVAGEPYAPMAPFAGLDGKAFRAEWSDEPGKKTVDVSTYELILGGRALQSTHRIEGSAYGGRTIIFYDEGAKRYVYHYFTTGGFHTAGMADMEDGVFTSVEAVNGHPAIAEVRAKSTFRPNEMRVEVVYVGKDGVQTPQPARMYSPTSHPGEMFPK